MLIGNNASSCAAPCDSDFTLESYVAALKLAVKNYKVVTFDDIPWGDKFVLWRHDVDFSLNRAKVLAYLERDGGMVSTYFVNPHSTFYNLAEEGQLRILHGILALGHRLGLHFDSSFHSIRGEGELDQRIEAEALMLEQIVGVKPCAFSFHNPGEIDLACQGEKYGGLLNCYSHRFKTEVPYCSDSNGYWRFRRLHDVLASATDPCLQVLTHPGWWQDVPMPPRRRLFRSAFGRAKATMRSNDEALAAYGRVNQTGLDDSLRFLSGPQPRAFELCDFLWNEGHFSTLFVELWRLHEAQGNRLCKAMLCKDWRVPARDVNALFGQEGLGVDGFRLFRGLFGETWQALAGLDADQFAKWVGVRNQLVHGKGSYDGAFLEQGCVFVCEAMARLADWGSAQPLAYDGLVHLGSIGLATVKTADGNLSDRLDEVAGDIPALPNRRWEAFKASIGVAPLVSGEA